MGKFNNWWDKNELDWEKECVEHSDIWPFNLLDLGRKSWLNCLEHVCEF